MVALQQQLNAAIQVQDFDRCASLKDQITALEAEQKQSAAVSFDYQPYYDGLKLVHDALEKSVKAHDFAACKTLKALKEVLYHAIIVCGLVPI